MQSDTDTEERHLERIALSAAVVGRMQYTRARWRRELGRACGDLIKKHPPCTPTVRCNYYYYFESAATPSWRKKAATSMGRGMPNASCLGNFLIKYATATWHISPRCPCSTVSRYVTANYFGIACELRSAVKCIPRPRWTTSLRPLSRRCNVNAMDLQREKLMFSVSRLHRFHVRFKLWL